jgi:hypothetical protein
MVSKYKMASHRGIGQYNYNDKFEDKLLLSDIYKRKMWQLNGLLVNKINVQVYDLNFWRLFLWICGYVDFCASDI